MRIINKDRKNVLCRSVQGHHMEELAKGAGEPHGTARHAREINLIELNIHLPATNRLI